MGAASGIIRAIMARQIALLRAVNVGDRQLAMAELRALAADELGYEDVATYVASGNLVFTAPPEPPDRLEAALATRFGFEVPVVLRTREELAELVAADPLGEVATDPAKRLVAFHEETVGPVELDPAAFAPETFLVREREVVVWCPGGIGRSPLADALTVRGIKGVKATARNWRTVQKLLALAEDAA
jgi:uncharacterized protein (DUF1697 family)